MRFSIAKFVVLALIVVLAIVAVNKYTSEKMETQEGDSLEAMLTAGLTDQPTTETEKDEDWDKPYSQRLVELIEGAEDAESQSEEDRQKMAGISSEEIFNEEFSTKPSEFPFVKELELEERARYNVVFEADKEIRFVVYAEKRYNTWKEKGFHVTSKITTNSQTGCCAASGSYNMDINIEEGGKYYFLFDNSDIEFESDLPTKIKLKVTKTGGI